MRWGVRRYQDRKGRLTRAGEKRYDKGGKKKGDADGNSKKRGLTKGQKRAIKIGAAVAVTALAAYGAYKLNKSGKLDELINLGKKQLQVKGLDADGASKTFRKLAQKETVQDAISKVNASGSRNNCYNVVVGTVGRLCGLDVVAKGDTQGGKGLSFDEVCKVFKLNPNSDKDVMRIMNPTVDRIANQIGKRFAEGDVGAIGLEWNKKYKTKKDVTAGHTLNWIIQNGKVNFVDGQAGKSGEVLKSFIETFLDSGKEVSVAKFANVVKGLNLETDVDINMLRNFVD
jgi:hypothetical protein